MRSFRNICVMFVVIVAAGALVWAAEEKSSKAADEKSARPAAAAAGADMPDPAKMMETMMKLGTPGPQHERLKALAGKWDAEVTVQMMPGMPEEKSKGTEVDEVLWEGRYLETSFTGDFNGMPFKGHGLWGYDNAKQKYISLWIDSMSTMVMSAEGTPDESGKIITVKCDTTCPMTGKPMAVRAVLTLNDPDHHTYESFASLDGGPEHKSMTIKYSRAK